MLTVMLFKLFEMSPDRADFVSSLFRRRPAGLDANTNIKT
jgi:hypothetical protein